MPTVVMFDILILHKVYNEKLDINNAVFLVWTGKNQERIFIFKVLRHTTIKRTK